MLVPFLLLLFSTASAAVVAYGTDARWGTLHHGLAFIIHTRQLQWPLVTLSLLLCGVLLMLVVAGRRRVWWLIGLLPVLTLFAHRFLTRPDLRRQPVEDPPLVDAGTAAAILNPGDWIIGVHFAGRAIAFPFAQMERAPAVLTHDREQRMMLMWSPGANKATAFNVGRELHARDLEVVSFPAEALLLYDSRLGAFINGITAETTAHTKPISFRDPMQVEKQTWAGWLASNPQTEVMDLPGTTRTATSEYDPAAHPVAESKTTVIFTPTPAALSPDDVPEGPVNVAVNGTPLLLLRDPATGRLQAFDPHLQVDQIPRFASFSDAKHPEVVMVDLDTNTEWSSAGTAVAGPAETRGRMLASLPVEADLVTAVMKFWFLSLQKIDRAQLAGGVQQVQPAATTRPSARSAGGSRRRRRRRAPAG